MTTYATKTKRNPDFLIRYRYIEDQGGHGQALFQHMRTDFLYEGDDPQSDGIHMIWPEFLAEDGTPLEEGGKVPEAGTATMWIVNPERRSLHAVRLRPGVRGFLVVGPHKIAEAQVIRTYGH